MSAHDYHKPKSFCKGFALLIVKLELKAFGVAKAWPWLIIHLDEGSHSSAPCISFSSQFVENVRLCKTIVPPLEDSGFPLYAVFQSQVSEIKLDFLKF